MPKKMLMLDLAREQHPTQDHLFRYAQLAQEAGYDSLGLYLEHRYAFKCTPWAHGQQPVTPQMIQALQSEFPSLQIIPFINVLGHMEGFIYTEQGEQYKEELFAGLQACPSNPDLVNLAKQMIDEVIQTFTSDLIHIGGDETYQLNRCETCQTRTAGQEDPKAFLYAQHFGPLLQHVLNQGRTPGIWGDMFLDHPDSLKDIPRETVIFDWQYMKGIEETAPKFSEFRVYGCPTLHIFNAPWFHIHGSEKNVREISQNVQDLNLEGVCITLWEGGLFGTYDSLDPALKWCPKAIDNPQTPETILDQYQQESEDYKTWATLMGDELEQIGGVFQFKQLRNPLKARLLLYGNPFLCWMHHHPQLSGPDGQKALQICEQALQCAPNQAAKNVTIFVRAAIEFVILAERAHQHYANQEPEKAIAQLVPTRYLFDTLDQAARENHQRIGSSLADVERTRAAKAHVETVIKRIREYGDNQLGYLPAFKVLTNPRFMPHDQACWWIVNKWANE